ncbi:hypothetical protein J3R83DRAFT_5488 [Lanmaoa asiatica]|nr:hypothetical protein J3R83DRAFT_5488 [Lanmaoa asiatica]
MVLGHLATPGVARGSELCPLRSTNSINGPRNFFFFVGYCTIICQHNKTHSMTGKDGFVVHFLPKAASHLFVYLLGPIREVVAAFSRIISLDSHSARQPYLYAVNGKTIDSTAFSSILRAYTLKYLRVPLTLVPFRQAFKTILQNILRYHEELESGDDAIDACFGHPSFVGSSHYSLVCNDLPELTENVYIDAIRLAAMYHSWLGLASPPPPDPQPLVKPPSFPAGHLVSHIGSVLPSLGAFRDQQVADLAAMENRIIEKCFSLHCQWSRMLYWQLFCVCLGPATYASPPSRLTPETILIHQSRIFTAGSSHRSGFSLPPSRPRRATNWWQKICGVSGTILFWGKEFHVVHVPYISLMEQALLDASEKGIPTDVWSSSNLDIGVFTVKLAFAAVKQVSKERFHE